MEFQSAQVQKYYLVIDRIWSHNTFKESLINLPLL